MRGMKFGSLALSLGFLVTAAKGADDPWQPQPAPTTLAVADSAPVRFERPIARQPVSAATLERPVPAASLSRPVPVNRVDSQVKPVGYSQGTVARGDVAR